VGGVVIDFDQIVSQAVRAINILNQTRELIVRDRFLIFLEHIPARTSAENPEILRRLTSRRQDRQEECEGEETSDHYGNKASVVGFCAR
jgi:hypothetical protein